MLNVIERYRVELIELRKTKRQKDRLEEELARFKRELEEARKETEESLERLKEMEIIYEELKEKAEKYKRQRDMYRGMVFKSNRKKVTGLGSKNNKRGGQVGHKGHGRRAPEPDATKRVYASNCPDCHRELARTENFTSHTVEDIPELLKLHTIVTKYQVERQWCGSCKKEVRAVPPGVIPHSRLGINLLVTGIVMRYGIPAPINKIVFTFKNLFGIKLSEAGLANLLHRTRRYLGPFYEQIIQEVRKARVKQADETGWRIEGINHWIWEFLSSRSVYYKIEETRKKEIPRRELGDSHEEDILVRDDYRGYEGLELKHQSCWAHLMRRSREAAHAQTASKEVKRLHRRLKRMYQELKEIVNEDFNSQEREKIYREKWKEIKGIIEMQYQQEDTRAIQTRITNQRKNLLTALLYEDVPLTNNKAERELRPMVVARKISGGSKTIRGAKTQAVNMSVFQTLKMREKPLALALQEKILAGAAGNN